MGFWGRDLEMVVAKANFALFARQPFKKQYDIALSFLIIMVSSKKFLARYVSFYCNRNSEPLFRAILVVLVSEGEHQLTVE